MRKKGISKFNKKININSLLEIIKRKKKLWEIKIFSGIYISFNISYSIILIN